MWFSISCKSKWLGFFHRLSQSIFDFFLKRCYKIIHICLHSNHTGQPAYCYFAGLILQETFLLRSQLLSSGLERQMICFLLILQQNFFCLSTKPSQRPLMSFKQDLLLYISEIQFHFLWRDCLGKSEPGNKRGQVVSSMCKDQDSEKRHACSRDGVWR